MQYKVTVVVPIYNIEKKLLYRCIDSVLGQTEEQVELLLIDDGSPDDSGIICDEYAEKDTRIKVFHTENRGVSSARNIGIVHASGEYLCFVDPDDYLEPDCVESTYHAIRQTDADILMFRHRLHHGPGSVVTGEVNFVEPGENVCQKINAITKKDGIYGIGMCWSKLFKKSFLAENHLKYELGVRKAQDRLFVYDCLCCNPKICTYDYIGYIYNTNNGNSICRRYNPEIIEILNNTSFEFQKRIQKETSESIVKAGYKMNVLFLNEMFLLYVCHKQNQETIGEKVKKIREIVQREVFSASIKEAELKDLSRREYLLILLLRLKMYRLCILMYKL